ncbi:MAG: hypothetical protein NTV51_03725 [Verrucomicrobia bacterium]|nr:hypothetical protein [Verrucomicrobiota bacterium]
MTFESLSKSPWILPGLPWLVLPIVLVLAAKRRGFFRVWGVAFALLIAADAGLNGALTPVKEGTGWATFCGVTFVILGDMRFFLAAEWDGSALSVGRGFVLAWIVPLLSQLFRATVPWVTSSPRATFLTYELLFLGVLTGYAALRVRRMPGAQGDFARKLVRFVGLQYVLWAGLDVFLFATRLDVGHGLRLVPDVLYYVLFVPWVLRLVGEAREPAPASEVRATHA